MKTQTMKAQTTKAETKQEDEYQFVTILPDGSELDMNDAAACQRAALRVELLSRGLRVPADFASTEATLVTLQNEESRPAVNRAA